MSDVTPEEITEETPEAASKAPIQLFQPPPHLGLPNLSPFCMKLEAWLKLAELDYDVVITGDPSKGPTGKIPWIVDDDQPIGDSSLIIQHLGAKHGIDLDEGLTAGQRALSRAIEIMVEDRLYWVLVYSRWIEPENWEIIKGLFFGKIPAPLRAIIAPLVQRRVRRSLWGQGLMRHPRDDIYGFGEGDIEAISALLGEKQYLIDGRVRLVDLTAVSVLAGIAIPEEINSPVKDAVRTDARLMDYIARVNAACGW